MKIIETIEGAAENTVVYEDESGARVAVTRPKIVSVRQIVAEIESSPSAKTVKTEDKKPVHVEEQPVPENSPDRGPDPSPTAEDGAGDTNTPKTGPGAKSVKNENTRKS